MRTGTGATVPMFRANLPKASALVRYLERLDDTRQYANRGDLACELERRLQGSLRLGDCHAVTTSTGTAAIQAAILAGAGRATVARPLAIVPGYTFVASAFAAQACGYHVVFADIDPDTLALSADWLLGHPSLDRAGVVVPVAPYGSRISQAEWAEFRAATGVPVVIDAAAAFEAIRRDPADLVGSIPVALSFQATKAFSTGEGGAVVWEDLDGLERVVQACNFGFLRSREARAPGFNGKMSEYHAAVGLAGLDALAEREDARQFQVATYAAVARAAGLGGRLTLSPDISSVYALFRAASPAEAAEAGARLDLAGIEHRRWYGRGAHREPYFSPAQPHLPETERAGELLIGVPSFAELTLDDMERIVGALCGRP